MKVNAMVLMFTVLLLASNVEREVHPLTQVVVKMQSKGTTMNTQEVEYKAKSFEARNLAFFCFC